MKPAARIAAAIEILQGMSQSGKPADRFLNEWARANRYAGAKDRNDIYNRVYRVLRRRAEYGWQVGSVEPRALVQADLRAHDSLSLSDIAQLFGGGKYEPACLSDAETEALSREIEQDAPDWVQGNYPEWLAPLMAASLSDPVAEGQALSARAPLDLRVNLLRARRERVQAALAEEGIEAAFTPWSPDGLRIVARDRITGSKAFKQGWVEVQDEGSQIAARFAAVRPGQQVVDLCAGGGGKTLAMAAQMENSGQIHAFDAAAGRLKAMMPRLRRAGVHNVQIASDPKPALEALKGRAHRVVLDVPCSGTGAWRRNPDAKWRLTADALANHRQAQDSLLRQGAELVCPAGRLVYITCSILACENGQRIEQFLSDDSRFQILPPAQLWEETIGQPVPVFAKARSDHLTLTPRSSGTDGFFICVMERVS